MLNAIVMLNAIFRFNSDTPEQAKMEAKKTMKAPQCRRYLLETQRNLKKFVDFLPSGPRAKVNIPKNTLLSIVTGTLTTGNEYHPLVVSLDREDFQLQGDCMAFPGTAHEHISMLLTPHRCTGQGNVELYMQYIDKGGLPLVISYAKRKIPMGTPLVSNWTEFTHEKQVAQGMAAPGSRISRCPCSLGCPNYYIVPKSGEDFPEMYGETFATFFQAQGWHMVPVAGGAAGQADEDMEAQADEGMPQADEGMADEGMPQAGAPDVDYEEAADAQEPCLDAEQASASAQALVLAPAHSHLQRISNAAEILVGMWNDAQESMAKRRRISRH